MKILRSLSALLFPSWCEFCGVGGDHAVCKPCEEQLMRMDSPYCQRCSEKMYGAGQGLSDCHYCRGQKFAFDYIVAAYQMNEELALLIHALKYKRALYLSNYLGSKMKLALLDDRLSMLDLTQWVVTSVPLHFTRERKRYFNQAELLGKALAQEVGMDYRPLLKRSRPTTQQIRLSKPQRAKNVADAFRVMKGEVPPQVILVDDVFTTGATVNECAKVLRRSGVKRVIVVCLARK